MTMLWCKPVFMLAWKYYDLSTFINENLKVLELCYCKCRQSLEAFKVRPANEQGISRQN